MKTISINNQKVSNGNQDVTVIPFDRQPDNSDPNPRVRRCATPELLMSARWARRDKAVAPYLSIRDVS
jgi:hypothetical protein